MLIHENLIYVLDTQGYQDTATGGARSQSSRERYAATNGQRIPLGTTQLLSWFSCALTSTELEKTHCPSKCDTLVGTAAPLHSLRHRQFLSIWISFHLNSGKWVCILLQLQKPVASRGWSGDKPTTGQRYQLREDNSATLNCSPTKQPNPHKVAYNHKTFPCTSSLHLFRANLSAASSKQLCAHFFPSRDALAPSFLAAP